MISATPTMWWNPRYPVHLKAFFNTPGIVPGITDAILPTTPAPRRSSGGVSFSASLRQRFLEVVAGILQRQRTARKLAI